MADRESIMTAPKPQRDEFGDLSGSEEEGQKTDLLSCSSE